MRLLVPIFSLGFLTLIKAQGTFQDTKFDLPPGLSPEVDPAQEAAPLHHQRKNNQFKPQKKHQPQVVQGNGAPQQFAAPPNSQSVGPSQPLQVIPQPQQGGAGAGLPFVPVPQQPLPQAQVPTFPQPQQGPMFGQPPQVPSPAFVPQPAQQIPSIQMPALPQQGFIGAGASAGAGAGGQVFQSQTPAPVAFTPAPMTFAPVTPHTFATFTFPTFSSPAPFSFPTLPPHTLPTLPPHTLPTLPTHPTFNPDPLGLFAHLTTTTPSPQNLTEQWNEYYRKYYLYYYGYDITKNQHIAPNQPGKPLPANNQGVQGQGGAQGIPRPDIGATVPFRPNPAVSATQVPFVAEAGRPTFIQPIQPAGSNQVISHPGLIGPYIGSHQQSLAGQVQGVAFASPQLSAAINQHGQTQPGPVQGGSLPSTSLNVDNPQAELTSAEVSESRNPNPSGQVAQFVVQNARAAAAPLAVQQASANSDIKSQHQKFDITIKPSQSEVTATSQKIEDEAIIVSDNKATAWFQEKFDTKECRKHLQGISQRFQAKFPSYLQKGGKDVLLAGLVEQRLIECDRKSTTSHWDKVDNLLSKISLSKSEESECRAGLIQERISCVNLLNYACQFVDKSYVFRLVPARITIQEARNAEAGAEKCRKVVRLVKKRLQSENLNRKKASVV
ncbi:hypothetical protein WR25_26158 [Diploscapter pachys]|uniref:Uncharacterized protein n=1 Tax=Diploscapter pachys TaxID=2018661 RepID=A0A2A2J618_9BILA|nr:hypothetical protein WR25_26158 [Diploscapter pachys]